MAASFWSLSTCFRKLDGNLLMSSAKLSLCLLCYTEEPIGLKAWPLGTQSTCGLRRKVTGNDILRKITFTKQWSIVGWQSFHQVGNVQNLNITAKTLVIEITHEVAFQICQYIRVSHHQSVMETPLGSHMTSFPQIRWHGVDLIKISKARTCKTLKNYSSCAKNPSVETVEIQVEVPHDSNFRAIT